MPKHDKAATADQTIQTAGHGEKSIVDKVPKGLLEVLRDRGLDGQVVGYACADMTNDGELRNIYLVLTEQTLYFAVSAESNEMVFSGAGIPKYHVSADTIGEIYEFPLHTISNPKILNQVVGGLLVVTIDGVEKWLCRFTSAKMREMRRLVDQMEQLVVVDKPESEPKPDHPAGGRRRGRRGGGPGPMDEQAYCPKCGMPYPEAGRTVCPRCMERRTIFVRVLKYFSAYKLRVTVLLLCILASSGLNAAWPYLSGKVFYDRVLGKDPDFLAGLGVGGNFTLALGLLVLSMVVIRLLQQLTGIIQGRMNAIMVPGVVYQIKTSVFEALQRLSIGFFTRSQTGSLMQRVNNDANEVLHFFIDGLPYLIFNVFTFAMSAAIMFSMDWRLATLALSILPLLFFISYYLLPRIWHAYGRNARVRRSLFSVLNDSLTGARVVKAFGQEEAELGRFDRVNNRVRMAEINIVRYNNLFEAAYSIARDVPILLVWCVGAVIITRSGGEFQFGDLMSFVQYLSMLQGPIMFFSQVFRWWANSMNAAQRVFEIIDSQPEVREKENPVELKLTGHIQLQNVTFGYLPNKPVLENISFEVRPGEMLGIVGKSGAGKTTLVNLISRLYDAEKGTILLDGVDIKDISFKSLRGAVAMVSQETYIFMGTIAENIAYSRPDATREEIVRAAMAAAAHDFICKLPDGYDTVIGVGGRQLSGGERQRISIARAILADPQILVLDEATASVDTETERAIQDSLDKLVKGRTTISIAHRLSTLRNADRLIVLEDGKLVEEGTHAELVRKKGTYFKLLQLQSKALAMRGID